MTSLLLSDIRRGALAALVPPPRLRLSEWIEENVHIPEGVSALPGPVRLWPYQREIADAIGDADLERVTLVKSVRVGFTTLLTSAMASYVANEPAPIMVLLPVESDCRDYIVSDIEPIFEASPALRGLLSEDSEEGHRNTLLHRRFAGGSLKVVAAKAPRNLRRHNIRVLLVDEADGMAMTPEGPPIALAEKRTFSYADRKIIIGSTPTVEETSNVIRSYAQSDQRIFEVPCPHCGAFTEILWKHIEWPEGDPSRAAFRCPHCQEVTEHRHKPGMVEQGRWRATRPDVKGHAGFKLNALVSLMANASWDKLATDFLGVKDCPEDLQTFVNTILAEGWKEDVDALDEKALQARAERFGLDAIPEEVRFITAGVDVQDDRLETTIVGWSKEEMFCLGHVVIWGTPDDDTTWLELDTLLRTRWQHPYGGTIGIDAAVVDSSDGDWTERVYAFCFPRARRRIMAGKGMHGSRPVLEMSKGKVRGGRLWILGVDVVKTTLMNRLALGRVMRFSDSLAPVWFEQLAGERKTVRYSRGQPVVSFQPVPGRRNEALDCTVYAYAARQVVPSTYDQRETDLRQIDVATKKPAVIRSAWMDKGIGDG